MGFMKLLSNLFSPFDLMVAPAVEVPVKSERVSLGNLLHSRLQAAADELTRARLAEEDRRRKQIEADAKEIKRFLEAVKVSYIHDIKRGQMPIPVYLPDSDSFGIHYMNSDKILHSASAMDHPNKAVFDEFFKWARDEGLYNGLFRHDDGRYVFRVWATNQLVK